MNYIECSQVLNDIQKERERQADLVAAGRIKHDCACYFTTPAMQMPVLIEEVGEWATAVHKDESTLRQYTEIIQVAAVAAAIAESLRQKLSSVELQLLNTPYLSSPHS